MAGGSANVSGAGGSVTAGGTGGAFGGAGGGGGGTGAGAGGTACVPALPLAATGATIDVTPPMKIAAALATAKPGDRLLLHAGTYSAESISKLSFAKHVFIEVAPGDKLTLPGLHFTSTDHIVLDGIRIEGLLELEGSSDFVLRKVELIGQGEDAALQFQGQHAAGANHDVAVEDSTISGGGRTVFVLGNFAPSEQWNHHLSFRRSHFTCGSHTCFQISGGRDIEIQGNQIDSDTTSGVLTAGATRVNILQNVFKANDSAAMQIATPGMEWDNYAGVENMISSKVLIANNVVSGFKTGVQLDAATDVAIVYNTFVDGAGVRFNHRIPHDQAKNVILNGNDNIRIWNDIMLQLALAQADKPPALLSNNLISGSGSGGDNPITGDPKLDVSKSYALSAGSPAIDKALVNAETPLVDFAGSVRGDKPDVGAHELGAPAPLCPSN
jgi:Right handed beta helix region